MLTRSSVIPGLCGAQGVGADPGKTLPLIDWNFTTTPQSGLGGRSIHYARGKTLGGSSALNFMVYHRGTKGSYDKWADEVADDSYTFDNLLPYFQRSTHITPPDNETMRDNVTIYHDHISFNNDLPYHQPLHVSWAKFTNAFSTWSEKALNAVGLGSSPGFDNGVLNGANYVLTTIAPDKQHRDSSQTSFLDYAMRSTDIKVYTHSMARQVLFSGNTTTGVIVTTGGQDYTLSANKEVILSAGAFQSPQLLMVSGVGPKDTLKQYGINVVKDLPGVGQSMMDQVYFGVANRVTVPTASKLKYDSDYAAAAAESYRANGTGPLTVAADLIAFERLVDNVPELLSNTTIDALRSDFPADWPDVEYLAQDTWSSISNANLGTTDDNSNYAEIIVAMLSPFSRGNLTISSADATDPPVINPDWLADPRDKDQAIAAFKRLRQIWSNMDEITIGEEYKPGTEVQSNEEIWDWIQKDVITIWHAASTWKMGRGDDVMAVVDSKARVYGVEGLRVVDASAFPFLTPGHPQSGIYMLAEKIAEDIKMGR
jgi:choline dehydrogenase